MKGAVIIALLGLVAVAYGGVGVLSPAEEQDVLALYLKICSDGRSEASQVGDAKIFCKNSPDLLSEIVNHQVQVPGTALGDQVVFIRPPPVVYKHNVNIQGGGGAAQKTKIYVLPQKSQHEISSQYNPGPTVTQKPTVYFLKSDGAEGTNFGYRYGNVPQGAAGYA
ncbi:unnamed protein product [Orchesella dallaii]|uniref:DUF243 domain-containing protein n=1 Tax=Orchesella dallaii TaxID=48710 RepID=A0ABP1REW0_9HEXA